MQYAYGMFQEDLHQLTQQIRESGEQFDEILALARGGAVPGVCLSHRLGIPVRIVDWSFREQGRKDWLEADLAKYKIATGKRYLIVDDILDSGTTLSALYDALGLAYGTKEGFLTARLCVLIRNVKNTDFKPDFYARTIDREVDKQWVNFWWEEKQC